MILHVPFKNELKSKLNNLQSQAKKKYIDVSSKLLVLSINSVSHFARHLIVLQGKNPDYVAPEPITEKSLTRAISNIRPYFFGSTRGWSKSHFTKPEDFHPILRHRAKLDEKSVLEVSKESSYNEDVLQKTLVAPTFPSDALFKELVREEAFLKTLDDFASKTIEKEKELDEVEVISGSRAVSKKKKTRNASKKKIQSVPKKTARVKKIVRVKKGVFHRVED